MSAQLAHKAKWEAGLGDIVKQAFHSVPQIPVHLTLVGQSAIVTGGNVGLGLECARQFLQKGLSDLILAVRSEAKGEAAARPLRTQFPFADIHVWILDMESYESVRSFAARCATLDRLDIAVLNAGCGKLDFQRVDGGKGREVSLQVNYLSTVLLGILLVPILGVKSEGADRPGRLVFVGSNVGHHVELKMTETGVLDGMDTEEGFHGFEQYGKTKLALLMFVSKLAQVVEPSSVIVNVVAPGAVRDTALLREARSQYLMRALMFVNYWLLGRNLADGTRQYLHAAMALGQESHGSLVDFAIRPYVAPSPHE